MSFSVLLSLYYKENHHSLQQSLDSIFMQSKLPDEVILVEDGPLTEILYAVVAKYTHLYPIIKIISLPQNVGLGQALNEGLKHCSYDLVARMDTDDIAKPNRFEKQLSVFEQNPDIDICSAWIEEFADNTDNIISVKKVPEKHWDILRYAQSRCPINHPAVMFRKSSLLSVGGYQHFPLLEDYYLWIRLLINGAKFYNIQESLLYFRTSQDMFARRGGWKYLKNEIIFWKLAYKYNFVSLFRFLKNILVRIPARLCPTSIRKILYTNFLRQQL
ncbi:MAG: glycosyltransferase [Muribaculaceae bacterium]|nr:glycosyltransferase [Muribaculaceae bacterium]